MLGNKGSKQFYRTGGTRGGQTHFKWDDVKSDKYRENYLGHSVLAPVGRWQKGKDLQWYAKLSQEDKKRAMENEKDSVRQNDEDLINEALGLKPKKKRFVDQNLDSVELKQILARGETERTTMDIERVKGLGAAPAKLHEHIERGPSAVEKEILKLRDPKSQMNENSIDQSRFIELDKSSSKASEVSEVSVEKSKKSKKESKEKKAKKEHKQKKDKKHK